MGVGVHLSKASVAVDSSKISPRAVRDTLSTFEKSNFSMAWRFWAPWPEGFGLHGLKVLFGLLGLTV